MNITAMRDFIAESLSNVDGVVATPYRPEAIYEGMAWIEWSASIPEATLGICRVDLYELTIFLAVPTTSVEVGERYVAEVTPEFLNQLAPYGLLDRMEPVSVVVSDSSTVPAVRIRLTVRGD